jgi:hypothetical protein
LTKKAARGRDPDEAEALSQLWAGQSAELLKELHVLTRDGRLNQDSRRKLKQVQHLVTLLKPAIEPILASEEQPVIADVGAGKSYLGFILYDALLRHHPSAQLVCVEQRADLAAKTKDLAQSFGFERISVIAQPVAKVENLPLSADKADVVTALHACDTATDDAIAFGLRQEAKVIAVVPCCQAEVSALLEHAGPHALRQLWRHPIQRREFGSHLTNVLRALFLEAQGFRVRVTEFVGFEHSMKNELILAERIQRSNTMAEKELKQLLEQIPVRPHFLKRF